MKAAIVYSITGLDFDRLCDMDIPEASLISQPSPSEWGRFGFYTGTPVQAFPVVQQGAITYALRSSERLLPSKVRDEHLTTLVDEFRRMEGRKPSKKEFRIMRDQVETELLPRAFIKHSDSLMTVTESGRLICWVSSATKAEKQVAALVSLLDVLGFEDISITAHDYHSLTYILLNGGREQWLVGKHGVIASVDEDNPTIRLKAVDMESEDVLDRVRNGYEVNELALHDEDRSFVFTSKGVLKKLELGVTNTSDAFESDLFIAITEVGLLTDTLITSSINDL